MVRTRSVSGILSTVVMVLGASVAFGQDYPNKPMRIVTVAVGGGADVVSRLIAPEISIPLGQPVIVENRQGLMNGEIVSKATPDGYTLLVAANNFIYASLLQKISFDPIRDFAPITQLVKSPSVLVVHPSLQVNTVKDLIALAKAKPGKLNYGSGGAGGTSHLTAELFKAMAGVDIVRIPYKGSALSMNALLAAEVHMTFDSATAIAGFVKSGKLRALAVTSTQPSPLAPGVPTVTEFLPGFEALSINVMFAPANTPAPIINRLNQEVVRVLHRADVKEKFLSIGVEVVGNSPSELAAAVKSEIARIGKVIKDANIRVD